MADFLNPIPAGAPSVPSQGSGAPGFRATTPSETSAAERPSAAPASSRGPQAALGTPKAPVDPRKDQAALDRAESSVRSFLESTPTNLQFTRDTVAGRTVFKVVNPQTREVIRQVPSEEVLAMARRLRQLEKPDKAASGVLLEEEG